MLTRWAASPSEKTARASTLHLELGGRCSVVARSLPFKSRDKPNEELPSISDEMQQQIEADQKDIKKQLQHAQQQLDRKRCCYPT